jgi:uncharacterized protein YgiM (DUF1202 family)
MKKRWMNLLLFIALCMGLLPGTASAGASEYGQVTAQDVRLRSAPNTDSEVLSELPQHTLVEVLDSENGWYRVMFDDMVGYLRQDYILVNSTSRAANIGENGAVLFGGPGNGTENPSYPIARLPAGYGIKVKQMAGDWYYVVAGDSVGYVYRADLKLKPGVNASGFELRVGMQGEEVEKMQKELRQRQFLSSVTGTFDDKTKAAVASFQKACGLSADGVAGAQTLQALYDINNKVTMTYAAAADVKGKVELLDWFKGGDEWLYKGAKFKIIDVKTGLSFNARRFGGWYHADSEPLTANDTAIMKKIAGGEWSWDRRPIWVVFRGRVVAASMHCMPHMANPTQSNNFPGHFCVHLLNSKVHETGKPCPRHQACVQAAYRAGK